MGATGSDVVAATGAAARKEGILGGAIADPGINPGGCGIVLRGCEVVEEAGLPLNPLNGSYIAKSSLSSVSSVSTAGAGGMLLATAGITENGEALLDDITGTGPIPDAC